MVLMATLAYLTVWLKCSGMFHQTIVKFKQAADYGQYQKGKIHHLQRHFLPPWQLITSSPSPLPPSLSSPLPVYYLSISLLWFCRETRVGAWHSRFLLPILLGFLLAIWWESCRHVRCTCTTVLELGYLLLSVFLSRSSKFLVCNPSVELLYVVNIANSSSTGSSAQLEKAELTS